MSIPRIPGYSTPDQPGSLADLWKRPAGDYPSELWPEQVLRDVTPVPTGWLTINEHYFEDDRHGDRAAVLVRADDIQQALGNEAWIGDGLGGVGLWSDGVGHEEFDDGLTVEDRGLIVEFIVQVRAQHNLRDPVVEISHPFLWYWDAIQTGDGWDYLDGSGQNQPLVRCMVGRDSWRVEVRALELRRYLADVQRVLVAQVAHVSMVTTDSVQRADINFENDWARFSWACGGDRLTGDRPNFSRLLGQYVVHGSTGAAARQWTYRKENTNYPEFTYATDPETGSSLKHTCDPDQLGTYFDRDNSRLHYLTPVYFSRNVLSKYAADPLRYEISWPCAFMWD